MGIDAGGAAVEASLDPRVIDAVPGQERNLTRLLLLLPGVDLQGWQYSSSENPQ